MTGKKSPAEGESMTRKEKSKREKDKYKNLSEQKCAIRKTSI
jgi:hypothetical protein